MGRPDKGSTPGRPVSWSYGRSQDGLIRLYAGDLLVRDQEVTRHVRGDVTLRMGPRPALRAHFAGEEPWLIELARRGDWPTVEIPPGSDLQPPSASAVLARPRSAGTWANLDPRLNQLIAGNLKLVDHLVLYVVGRITDWPLPQVETNEGNQGQVLFSLPGWDLRLAVIDQLASEIEFSYAIEALPHSKNVGHPEVQVLIRRVQLLLTFLTSGNASLGPKCGIDLEGRIVWVDWGAPFSVLDRGGVRWCTDKIALEALPALAGGLANAAEDPGLEACVDRAVSLLIAANEPGSVLDVKIPIACSGLELLAWSVLQHREWLSSDALGKLSAASCVRLLLRWANIPTGVPPSLAALSRRQRSLGATDNAAPELAFFVRNRVVHPPKKLTDPEWPSPDELFESWLLSTWFLELLLLRILSYDGEYSSRLQTSGWTSDTELVPWSCRQD